MNILKFSRVSSLHTQNPGHFLLFQFQLYLQDSESEISPTSDALNWIFDAQLHKFSSS